MGVFTTIPPNSEARKSGQLNPEQLEHFFTDGYLIIDNVFKPSELRPALKQIDDDVDLLAQELYDAGKIKNLHKDADVFHRLTLIEQQFAGATVILHKNKKVMPKSLCDLFAHERVLNLMEQLIGPNVAASAVWNVRQKTPKQENHDVPWHQDSSYLLEDADKSLIVTTWIPLCDTNFENGGLQVLRKGHRFEKVGPHKGCWRNTWYLYMENEDVRTLGCDPEKDVVTCEVPLGGILIFSNLLPHRSVPNLTNKIRWSLDWRYQSADGKSGSDKPPLVLRLKDEPSLKPDWTKFNSVDRHKLVFQEDDPFSTKINPELWTRRWPIVHENQHTALRNQKN